MLSHLILVILLYSFFTKFIFLLFGFLSIFSPKLKNFLLIRESDLERARKIEKFSGKLIWLHAASVGELDQCKAIARVILANEKNTKLIQSVFSDSVTDKQLEDPMYFFTFRLPLDSNNAYDDYFEIFQPKMLIISAWDTWYFLLKKAKQKGVKTILANSTLGENSGRRNFFIRNFTKKVFESIDIISCVSKDLIPIFSELAPNSKIVSLGDSRFDSVIEKIESRKNLEMFLPNHQKVFILASTYIECEKIFIPVLKKILDLGYSIWIFPHKVHESRINEISTMLKNQSLDFTLYSSKTNSKIILFDKLGVLAYAYEKAEICYVGGGLHNRVHNVMEGAYFGLPIFTGEKVHHSFEAIELKTRAGLFTFKTTSEFWEKFQTIDESERIKISKINKEFISNNRGASERLYQAFLKD
ncbi:MAG: glycosyltransferase N-terminal domain-containing protein [Leptospiraceae bacterium]|nr:glycosyltransferase N-terminal domain-containing protein [Leptospiraceae bacterium]